MGTAGKGLEEALTSAGESLFVCDATGTIVGVSDSLCSLTGYDRKDLLSRKVDELAEAEAGRVLSGLHGVTAVDVETGFRCKDGSTKRLELRFRSIQLAGQRLAMVRVGRRRRAADRLPENPEFIRALLHSSGMLIVCVTGEGRVAFANSVFEGLVGLPFPELRGRVVWELLEDPSEQSALRRLVQSTDALRVFECLWTSPGTSPRKIAWSGTRLGGDSAGPSMLLFIGRELDVKTEFPARAWARRAPHDDFRRRDLEARIAQVTLELDRVRAEYDSLIHTLAHDGRGPIRAMAGLADALVEATGQHAADPGATADLALRISAASRQMNDLIENLLAYNRLSQMRLQAEEFPLTLLLEEVLLAMGDQIRARSATVRVDSPPLEVLADRQVLFLLLTQLVSNALKFVRPGVPPDVTLRAERKGASLRLSVQDNGIGISREYHEQIWKPGTRLNPIETYPGTGMGLAIVAKAADRLLGRLGLESEEGNGSRFWVDLPVEPE